MRDALGRFEAGASGNPAGRPPLARDPAEVGREARRRATRLLEWVLHAAVIGRAASMTPGAGELLAAADAMDEASRTLRDLARLR